MPLPVRSHIFGILPNGKSVPCWTLQGAGGLRLEVITYGARITRLMVPDREGRLAAVVLGFDTLDRYLADRFYFGAIAGRVAGRIAGARFDLDGSTYQLPRNDGANHIHGGNQGFAQRTCTPDRINETGREPAIRLTYLSPDGEEGYPGTVNVSVTYVLTDDNCLRIETEASSDRPTPFSLTQHSYFNLGGEDAGSIVDHELQIHADEFVPIDDDALLLDLTESVTGGVNDFRKARNLGAAIPFLFKNHGDLYLTRRVEGDDTNSRCIPAARLFHPPSGRSLAVSTTETHLQLYTGCSLDGSVKGKSGARYGPYAGVCLECEGYPNGANARHMGDIILVPGKPRREITEYAFGCVDR